MSLSPEQYRAKAAEFAALAKKATDQVEARRLHGHERSLTILADNEQWLAVHYEQTVHRLQGEQPAANEFTSTEDINDAGEGGLSQ